MAWRRCCWREAPPSPRRSGATGLVDRLALFVAPLVLGAGPNALEGWPAMRLGEGELELSSRPVGPDTLLVADVHEV